MTPITRNRLIERLRETVGAMPVTIIAETLPKLKKNPFGKVRKISRVNGFINWHYANSVNNQRAREGNDEQFIAKPRKWGNREENSPLVEHHGALYLEMKVERSLSHEYRNDFGTLTDEIIKPFLYEKPDSGRQEVEKTVILRDYKIDNIVGISMNKEEFVIV